jgi:hypothetical protein
LAEEVYIPEGFCWLDLNACCVLSKHHKKFRTRYTPTVKEITKKKPFFL